jgi:hypothetical protein
MDKETEISIKAGKNSCRRRREGSARPITLVELRRDGGGIGDDEFGTQPAEKRLESRKDFGREYGG